MAVLANTLWGLMSARAEASPDQLLLVESDHKEQRATVAECMAMAESLAAGLYAKGIKPGTVVAWQMPTRLQTVVLSLALARIGAVQNPILHLFRERELQDLLCQTKPEWLLVPVAEAACDYPAQGQKIAESLGFEVLVLDDDMPQGDVSALPAAPTDSEQVRWLYCTSGTTSGPKAVLHTDATLMAGGMALGESLEPVATDITSIAYPFAHIGGLMMLSMILQEGIPAVLMDRFDIVAAAESFKRLGVTMTGGSTAHYQAWLALQDKHGSEPLLPALRMLTGGGASKPPQYYYDVKEKMGVPIVHSYGMTESPMVGSNRFSSSERAKAYTDGCAASGMDVRIQRNDGSWADLGEVGEVVIKGGCVCKGYLNPEQTKEAFDEQGYYHTGDLGSMDDEGHVTLSGRLKDIIIRKGENISAREIEEFLLEYPNVNGVAVIGLPDEERGERVCAVLETSDTSITLADIGAYLTDKGLMKIKLPEQLEILAELPRSQALGKVSKKDLQAQFANTQIGA